MKFRAIKNSIECRVNVDNVISNLACQSMQTDIKQRIFDKCENKKNENIENYLVSSSRVFIRYILVENGRINVRIMSYYRHKTESLN